MKYTDSMYRKAFDIRDIAPWKGIGDDQLISFYSEAMDEMIYVNFMGRLGQHLALGVYIGDEGIQSLYDIRYHEMRDPATLDADILFAMCGQNCVQISFESRNDAFEDQLPDLMEYAQKYNETIKGYKDIPSFIDFYPQWEPSTLKDPVRLKVLDEAMTVVILYNDLNRGRFKNIPPLNMISNTKAPYFEKKNGKWELSTNMIPTVNPNIISPDVPFEDGALIRRLKKLPRGGELEVKLISGIWKAWNDEGDMCGLPHLLIVRDCESETIEPPILLQRKPNEPVESIMTQILDQFISNLEKNKKKIPDRIICSGMRTMALLYEFCDEMEIELDEDDYLDEVDEAIESFCELQAEDENGITGAEHMIEEMVEMMEKIPRTALKDAPSDLKDALLSAEDLGMSPDLVKRIKNLAKYF
ncbi:MAG: hypothetical protein IJ242_00420 [Clostridia bacterium]|nr:hypothetical protein [Clostridia bacterium]